MKKNKYIIILCLLFSGILASCDGMLETKNYTDMSPANFFKSEGDFDAAVTGLYLPCSTNWGYTDGGTGKWQNALFNADINANYAAAMVTTDIMKTYSSHIYEEFNVGPASGGAIGTTYNVIRFVARATDVIHQIANSTGVAQHIRDRYLAEAKTLRAFYMYVLYDWFGPVNVKLDPATLMDNAILPRPSKDEYIRYILADLGDAIDTSSFPTKYNDDPANWGRMSKSIACALKLRLYMHEKDWQNARQAALEIMDMGFAIIPNYEELFNQTITNEHIWSIPSNTASDNYYVTEVLPSDFKRGYNHLSRPYIRGSEDSFFSGWQVYCMRWDYYDTFEDNDVRKQTILCEYDAADGTHKNRTNGMVGAIPIKYTDTQFANYGIQKAQPVIRYAEVLLSYAEAENELNGPTATAVNAVKQITDRAGVVIPSAATAGKEAFRDYILYERGHELFGEGVRRQDLIRHGKFIQYARERGNNAQDYHVLFPIPQSVITEANGIIEQNPGYTN